MLNDANSGWIYQIGDSIFENVLLIDCENLKPSLSVYASSLGTITGVKKDVSQLKCKYDCIIINATNPDSASLSTVMLNNYININGVVAIISNNETSFKNLSKIKYPWFLLKKTLYLLKSKASWKPHDFVNVRYYIQSTYGRINEVFYKNGYTPIKNPFLLKEKIKSMLLSKYSYPIFSSNTLDVISTREKDHKSVIDNIIFEAGQEMEEKFISINSCLILPFKVLVSVLNSNNQRYIFLLLRGPDKNIRANKELEMIKYLNKQYKELAPYISTPLTSGNYKNVEYIVYRELSGTLINSHFDRYNTAERSAFEMLLYIGDFSKREVVIKHELIEKLSKRWISLLKESFKSNENFDKYFDELMLPMYQRLYNKPCTLILFHGDYKIENILFNPNNYSVNGIIDWDLSEEHNLPGLDLLYLMIYSRRIKNSTSFIQECDNIFMLNGFERGEKSMIEEYCQKFKISDEIFKFICVMFLIHHFSCRERSGCSEKWFTSLLNSILRFD